MIELITVGVLILLGFSLYLNENMINKNKIQFDLLEDRNIKKVKK